MNPHIRRILAAGSIVVSLAAAHQIVSRTSTALPFAYSYGEQAADGKVLVVPGGDSRVVHRVVCGTSSDTSIATFGPSPSCLEMEIGPAESHESPECIPLLRGTHPIRFP
jgi:hypothetical protein